MIKNLTVLLILLAGPLVPAIAAPSTDLYPLKAWSSGYGLALDITPAPAALVGYCPACAGHALVGPAHDLFVLTRAGEPVAEIGAAWAYAPNTTGNLASGGAAVVTVGVNVGTAARAAFSKLPAAGEALGVASPYLDAAASAITIRGFAGPRVGGANGLPRIPAGVAATVGIPVNALKALFGY